MRNFYVICFDVLGQKDVLEGVSLESFSMSRKTDFQCQLMREMSEKILASLKGVISTESSHYGATGLFGAFQFSDTFIVYVEDIPEQHSGCVKVVRAVLVQIGYWYWEMLEKRMPIRGFVTYGEADVVQGGGLIGPVFEYSKQYEKCAGFSRIIFAQTMAAFANNEFGDLVATNGVLNVLANDILEKVEVGTLKLAFSGLHENLTEMSDSREVLRKKYKAACALLSSGYAQAVSGDNGNYADFGLMSSWPQYPRLRPDDYIAAYLRVESLKVRASSKSPTCLCAGKCSVDKVVAHFSRIVDRFADNAVEIFREHLCENVFGMDENAFVKESKEVDLRIQQINQDILVSTKNESKVSVFALAYALGELSLLVPDLIAEGFFIRGCVVDGCGWLVNNGLYGPIVRKAYDDMPESQILISEIANEEFRANEIVCRYACQGPDYYFAMPRAGYGFVNYRARLLASGRKRDEVLELLARLPPESDRQKDGALTPSNFSSGLVRELRRFADRLSALECEGRK